MFLHPPHILVVGNFTDDELNNVMEQFIKNNDCYLFTIVRGGLGDARHKPPIAAWAERNGCPQMWVTADTLDLLLWKLEREVDYVIAKRDVLSQGWKNFVMKLKVAGKHGWLV